MHSSLRHDCEEYNSLVSWQFHCYYIAMFLELWQTKID